MIIFIAVKTFRSSSLLQTSLSSALYLFCLTLTPLQYSFSAEGDRPRKGGKNGPQEQPIDDVRSLFKTEIPEHPIDIILGRPTQNSATVSILALVGSEMCIRDSRKNTLIYSAFSATNRSTTHRTKSRYRSLLSTQYKREFRDLDFRTNQILSYAKKSRFNVHLHDPS